MPTIRFVLELLTPLAHFDTRTGIDNPTNMRLAMTQPALVNGRRVYVPHVSENMLRTAMIRAPLADHLVQALGVPGSLPRGVLNLLYAGGAMGSGGRVPGDETALGHAVMRLYPSLGLLGGAVDAMILPRSKLKLSAWLVAREYLTAIRALFPEEADRAPTASAYDLLGDETRTRGTGDEAQGSQMLYTYQTLAAGARIAVEATLDPFARPEVVGALAQGLSAWPGFIGGQGRQGRGRARVVWLDPAPDPEPYLGHIAANADAMRAGLLDGTLGAAKPLCAA